MDILLQTKLTDPIIRDRRVPRPQLLQRLEDGLLHEGKFQRRLTLVAAPAGYGKTTLVTDWLRATGRPFGWLSLDETDNDPNRFLAYLIAAVCKSAGTNGIGNAAQRAMQSPQIPPPEAVISILLNELAASPQAFSLVLDDYHVIHTPQIHSAVTFFLEHQPPSIHLVVITREDPLLPVPRLRARGQALEVRQDDLRFSPAESSQFLNVVMDLHLLEEDLLALDQRTEGWAAGLQLAALAIQGLSGRSRSETRDFIQAFAGSSRFVIDYLISEVFRQQPAEVQEFLLKTAILERMTPPLCDAVTGQPGSRERLEHLDQSNLFIIPLDQDREWYRYHHLFAEFLRHQMRVQFPSPLSELHRSASRWYAANGYLADAMEHALSAEDWELAAALIDQAKDAMLRRGEIYTLLTWYRKLPEALVRARVELALGFAWPLVLSGQFDLAESLLAAAEPLIHADSLDQGDLYAIRAFLARSRGDHASVITYSEQALALIAQANPAARGTLAVNLGIAYWHSGRLSDTEQVMSEVEHIALQTNNLYALATARFFRVRTLATRGQLRAAESLYLEMLRSPSARSPITALIHFDLAALYLEWNRLEQAELHIDQGMAISTQTGNAEFISSGHILRAYASLGRRNSPAAWEEAEKANKLSKDYPPGVQARSESLFVLVSLAAGKVDQAAHWMAQRQAAADAHPFYRFIDLTLPRLLLAQGRKAEAGKLLADGCQKAREQGWGYGLIAALVLQTLADATSQGALEHLSEALRLAEPDGYLRTFTDAGAALIPFLREAARQGIVPDYAGQILAEMAQMEPPSTVPGMPEPLSERELEVLRLVVAGLSNREIARQLVVTPGTVKTHIHHICGKLSARNRTEAAMCARELHLV